MEEKKTKTIKKEAKPSGNYIALKQIWLADGTCYEVDEIVTALTPDQIAAFIEMEAIAEA